MENNIYLGIDASLTSSGFCVMNNDKEVITYGTIKTKPSQFDSFEKRIYYIADTIVSIAKEYNVTHIALEDIFFATNPKSTLLLGRLRRSNYYFTGREWI